MLHQFASHNKIEYTFIRSHQIRYLLMVLMEVQEIKWFSTLIA